MAHLNLSDDPLRSMDPSSSISEEFPRSFFVLTGELDNKVGNSSLLDRLMGGAWPIRWGEEPGGGWPKDISI